MKSGDPFVRVSPGLLCLAGEEWWRRRESNPRPRKAAVGAYVRFRFGFVSRRVGAGKRDGGLVRLISAWGSGPKPCAYPAK